MTEGPRAMAFDAHMNSYPVDRLAWPRNALRHGSAKSCTAPDGPWDRYVAASPGCIPHRGPGKQENATDFALNGLSGAVWRELVGDRILEPGVEHEQDLIARLDDRLRRRHESAAVAQHADDQA